MKNKLLMTVSTFLLLVISACGTPVTPTPSDESFSFVNKEAVKKDGYSWLFEEDKSYKDDIDLTISSDKSEDELKLYIDGNNAEKYHASEDTIHATLSYELDPDHPCNTESVEACQNTIKLNGKYVDLLHNDLTKIVEFDTEKFLEGENVINLNIGYVYLVKEYDKRNVRYKPGWGDDFRLKNFGIQLSDGTFIEPYKMVGYYCNETVKSYITQEMDVDPHEYYWIGDGWGDGEYLSHINHKDPDYERPFSIDYYFNYSKKNCTKNYLIDTNELEDGEHIVTGVSAENGHVLQNHFKIDNTAPKISMNIEDDMSVTPNYPFTYNVVDSTSDVKSTTIKLDGIKTENPTFSNLEVGPHSVSITAEDNAGNSTASTSCFNIVKNANYLEAKAEGSTINVNKKFDTNLTFNEYEKTELKVDAKNSKNTTSNTNLVSQVFNVNVTNPEEEVLISYDGTTQDGEHILFEAYNETTESYEKVFVSSNGVTNFKLDPTDYLNYKNQIRIKVSPYKVDNGSDKMLWASDIQYLAKTTDQFKDLSEDYNKLMSYMAKEYSDNNIAYMINTGDIVDDNPTSANTRAEWKHASAAFDLVDKVGLPYGVCAGNHDVGSAIATLDYSYYWSKFSASRTGNTNYYGQSLNNNACHYDLITVGNYDFLMLYLSYGVEGDLDTICWANKVLKSYPNRNAIICTHAYLDNDGSYDSETRAQTIFDELVTPNDNVKMVFCGHTDGSCVMRRKTETGRVVFELLSCFQFVETTSDNKDTNKTSHLINGYKCNGEGWIKEITVKDNSQLSFHTFSPILNNHNFSTTNGKTYATPDFTIKLDLVNKENILNTNSFTACQLGNAINEQVSESSYTRKNNDSVVMISDSYGGYSFVA